MADITLPTAIEWTQTRCALYTGLSWMRLRERTHTHRRSDSFLVGLLVGFTWLQPALHIGHRVRFHFVNDGRPVSGGGQSAAAHLQADNVVAIDAAPKDNVSDHAAAIGRNVPVHRLLCADVARKSFGQLVYAYYAGRHLIEHETFLVVGLRLACLFVAHRTLQKCVSDKLN